MELKKFKYRILGLLLLVPSTLEVFAMYTHVINAIYSFPGNLFTNSILVRSDIWIMNSFANDVLWVIVHGIVSIVTIVTALTLFRKQGV